MVLHTVCCGMNKCQGSCTHGMHPLDYEHSQFGECTLHMYVVLGDLKQPQLEGEQLL